MTSLRLPVLALVALGLSLGAPILARDSGAQSTQKAPAASSNFERSELQAYANATVELRKISESYEPKMRAADSPEAQEKVRRAQQDEMIDAVKQTGLTVKKYNAISLAYRNDPDVAAKIDELVSQAQ